tara:strand:+ start:541 stop:744 length:204 start_codon:yes stop_codon:yes gene_type:complete
MSEIYIDCQPVGTNDEKIVIKKKKVSFGPGFGGSNQEVQIIVGSIIAFGVLSTAVYLGRKYFFTSKN